MVVGSGYGASIAASRCARAGQLVCVLERGKEWLPGDFPETFSKATEKTQVTVGGKGKKKGMQVFFFYCFMFSSLLRVERLFMVALAVLLLRHFLVPAWFPVMLILKVIYRVQML